MSKVIKIDDTEVYVAEPSQEVKGGLIVIHEIWGLNNHTKDVADRFARQGYLVYAPELLSGMAIKEKVDEQMQHDLFNPEKRSAVQPVLMELMQPTQTPEFTAKTIIKLQAVFNALYASPAVKQRVGIVGFCFGGSYCFNLAVVEPRLKAAVPFYGHCGHPVEKLRQINAPILAFYGENDRGLATELPDLENRMHAASVDFSYRVYANTGHAFFNDTNPYAYDKTAATDAWRRTLEFLDNSISR